MNASRASAQRNACNRVRTSKVFPGRVNFKTGSCRKLPDTMPPATSHCSRRRSLLLPDPRANALCASCPAPESECMVDGRIHQSQNEPGPGGASLVHHEFKPQGTFNSGGARLERLVTYNVNFRRSTRTCPVARDTSYSTTLKPGESCCVILQARDLADSGCQTQGNGANATGDGAGCMARISLEYSWISAFTWASSSCACSCLAFLKPA